MQRGNQIVVLLAVLVVERGALGQQIGQRGGIQRGRAGGGRRAGDSKGNRLDLTLNVIMLLHPIEAIKLWQQAAAHAGG